MHDPLPAESKFRTDLRRPGQLFANVLRSALIFADLRRDPLSEPSIFSEVVSSMPSLSLSLFVSLCLYIYIYIYIYAIRFQSNRFSANLFSAGPLFRPLSLSIYIYIAKPQLYNTKYFTNTRQSPNHIVLNTIQILDKAPSI